MTGDQAAPALGNISGPQWVAYLIVGAIILGLIGLGAVTIAGAVWGAILERRERAASAADADEVLWQSAREMLASPGRCLWCGPVVLEVDDPWVTADDCSCLRECGEPSCGVRQRNAERGLA